MNRKMFVVIVIAAVSFVAGFQIAEYNQLESDYFAIGKTTECPFLNKYPTVDKSAKCPYLEMNNSVENSQNCPFIKNREASNKCPYLNENKNENKRENLHKSIFHKSS